MNRELQEREKNKECTMMISIRLNTITKMENRSPYI